MPASILVPLDGSAFSEHALPHALEIARRAGARLYLVHVHESSPVAEGLWGFYDPRREEERWAGGEEYLRSIAGRCEEQAGVVVQTMLLNGAVGQTLSDYAREVGAELIVMTTHGRSGLSRTWIGSVADELVRRSSVPIVLLRPREDGPATAPARPLRRVLIPLDGSELSEQALGPALALGSLTGAEYTLLRIVPTFVRLHHPYTGEPVPLDQLDLDRKREAVDYLHRISERLPEQPAPVRTVVVPHAQPARGILEYVEDNAVDLIAMATHGRSGWSRIALGSVADKVLRGTRTPVLLYRPTETRTEKAVAELTVPNTTTPAVFAVPPEATVAGEVNTEGGAHV